MSEYTDQDVELVARIVWDMQEASPEAAARAVLDALAAAGRLAEAAKDTHTLDSGGAS